jgi:hypothetical protein
MRYRAFLLVSVRVTLKCAYRTYQEPLWSVGALATSCSLQAHRPPTEPRLLQVRCLRIRPFEVYLSSHIIRRQWSYGSGALDVSTRIAAHTGTIPTLPIESMASSLPPEVAGEGRDHGKSGKLLQSDNAQSLGRNGMGCFFLSACSYAGRVDRRSLAKEERCFDILRHQKSIAVQCLLSVKRELGV